MRRLAVGSLVCLLAIAPSGCAVFDATSYGFAILTGKRVVDVSGEAKRAKAGETVVAVNLHNGEVVGRATLDDAKRFRVQISLPAGEQLAVALHGPDHAALLLSDTTDKRHEAREQHLTAGSTTVAWALGSALAGLTPPAQGTWQGSADQWKRLSEHLPASYGIALLATASKLDAVGVGNPSVAATELASTFATTFGTLRTASGGHPRDAVLWPPLILGWTDAMATQSPTSGDLLGVQAATRIDLMTALDRVWAIQPYQEEQGGLEVRVPVKDNASQNVPLALPEAIKALRYRIEGALLPAPREGEIPRSWIRFETGTLVLRVPDMPSGFTKARVEIVGENGELLGSVEQDGKVSIAMIAKLTTPAIEMSVGTPTDSTPAARE